MEGKGRGWDGRERGGRDGADVLVSLHFVDFLQEFELCLQGVRSGTGVWGLGCLVMMVEQVA